MTVISQHRGLAGYSTVDDSLVEWIPIDIDLHVLQVLFERPADDPMYDSYPVTDGQRAVLERAVGRSLDGPDLEYFVEVMSDA